MTATVRETPATAPSKFVTAWTSFSSAAGDVSRGENLRRDDPIVQAAPGNFVEFGLPIREWPTVFDGLLADIEEQGKLAEQARLDRAKRNRVMLTAPLMYRLLRDLLILDEGRTLEKGSIVLEGDPLLAQHRSAFTGIRTPK